jgi:hypothetical protein
MSSVIYGVVALWDSERVTQMVFYVHYLWIDIPSPLGLFSNLGPFAHSVLYYFELSTMSATVKQKFRWEYFILSTNLLKETKRDSGSLTYKILWRPCVLSGGCDLNGSARHLAWLEIVKQMYPMAYDNIDVQRRPHLVALLESLHKQFHDSSHQTEQSKQLRQGIP